MHYNRVMIEIEETGPKKLISGTPRVMGHENII